MYSIQMKVMKKMFNDVLNNNYNMFNGSIKLIKYNKSSATTVESLKQQKN